MNKKKCLSLLITLIFLVTAIACCFCYNRESPLTVAIVPLDSRPCNTQYPQILGEAAGMKILLPPDEFLDAYLQASDKDALWRWLEKTAPKCDRILISTNQLFQGGLINSRNSDSFSSVEEDLEHLKSFCQAYPDVQITILSILPRLLPSQYDADLAPYTNELKAYGIAWDKALLDASPLTAPNIPQNALEKYRSLFLRNEQMLTALESLAANGSCTLIIGQDDAAEYCPANIIKRDILARNTANVSFIHGADELEMLILSSYLDLPPSEINIIIEDESALKTYFPYEGADLATILKEKLAFANIAVNTQAKDSIFIHTTTGDAAAAKNYLNAEHSGYTAIADIACTNRGDSALAPVVLNKAYFAKIHCYSGWNTCSNTLGTVLAHYRLSQAFPDTEKSRRAFLKFKAVRLSEDMIYQALIAPELKNTLAQKGLIDPSTTAFIADESTIATYLDAAYAPYAAQLQALFTGTQEILPGYTVTVSNVELTLTYPWTRAFEVKAESTFRLK